MTIAIPSSMAMVIIRPKTAHFSIRLLPADQYHADVHVRVKLCKRIYNGNQGFTRLFVFISVGTPQRSCPAIGVHGAC